MRYVYIALVMALSIFVGCDQTNPVSMELETNNAPPPQAIPAPTDLGVGDSVAGLNVAKLLQANGKESVALSELAGKTIVLQFWATW